MTCNIIPHQIRHHLALNGSGKIYVFPKFFIPKSFSNPLRLLRYHISDETAQHGYYFVKAVLRRKRQNIMEMSPRYLYCSYLKIMVPGNFLKNCLNSISNISSRYPFAILRGPYQMIFRIIYRMIGSFKGHVVDITYLSLPAGGGFSSFFTKQGIRVLYLHEPFTKKSNGWRSEE